VIIAEAITDSVITLLMQISREWLKLSRRDFVRWLDITYQLNSSLFEKHNRKINVLYEKHDVSRITSAFVGDAPGADRCLWCRPMPLADALVYYYYLYFNRPI